MRTGTMASVSSPLAPLRLFVYWDIDICLLIDVCSQKPARVMVKFFWSMIEGTTGRIDHLLPTIYWGSLCF